MDSTSFNREVCEADWQGPLLPGAWERARSWLIWESPLGSWNSEIVSEVRRAVGQRWNPEQHEHEKTGWIPRKDS